MSLELSVSQDVKELTKQIITKQNLNKVTDIKYQPGSEESVGYLSETIAVNIINENKTFHMFLKRALSAKTSDALPIHKLYNNEVHFYEKIYPAYQKFCMERGIEDALRNIPICFGTTPNIVALENLRERNFTLCDLTKPMNDAHIELVLKAFAKFHAVSYAFKDQDRHRYEDLTKIAYDFFSDSNERVILHKVTVGVINQFISKLDPVEDKHILKIIGVLVEELKASLISASKTLNEYSIFMQGDCHSKNMMFLYENEDKDTPTDIMLVDWQCIRPASPVFDLSYFFYPVASEKALDNLTYYLKLYHTELCKRIRLLGSDPDILYPYDILEKEWKEHCKYGFAFSFHIIKSQKMSLEVSVTEDVKELTKQIITKQNLDKVTDIKYQPGTEGGDGYVSETIAVNIINENKTLHMFFKRALSAKASDAMPIHKLYSNEVYFYEKIYPAYQKFCMERGVEDAFRNIPICYGTSPNIVALENLRERNFALCDPKKAMNDAHIELVLKAFAKFHSVSYAFKDQDRHRYEGLTKIAYDFFSDSDEKVALHKVTVGAINEFISLLDPIEDEQIFKKMDGLVEKLKASLMSASKTLNEYSIFMQGDCHSRNMMFLYENEDKDTPSDVMLVDWQCIRPASPVFDLSYFFYPVASEKALDNLNYYLKLYHSELCKRIRLLGSDPDILYPFDILEKEWKLHCRYGFAFSFLITKLLLSSADDIIDVQSFDFENLESSTQSIVPKLKKEAEYRSRMTALIEHMTKNEFI